ncbi:MAG: H-type small acid-soluble spore protein [Anaeromicrobium sp.]|jgi:H-type small acid-soluble spore protein|uniref:small, acid-soluble spore protein, H family n=1 Tax=Anaeromicrobium sp. TaxID=1929132 RepID=UPI0025D60F5C|nr:small, acid-soluble spore protein, H family [Anaeromicrobium sp.]MCT4595849.1 H-type small acid-soluble spore protein [Anaeromicrobium sp.]
MDKRRVKDIMDADENLEVLYRGISVWVEDLSSSQGEATVKVLDTDELIQVPTSELRETGRELK